MFDEARFVFLKSDSPGSQATILLQQYRERLTEMRALFQYEMSPRDITPKNLGSLEKELREITRTIVKSQNIKDNLNSADAAVDELHKVIDCLNLATDLLEMPPTPKRRAQLYQNYRDITGCFSSAIKRLQAKP